MALSVSIKNGRLTVTVPDYKTWKVVTINDQSGEILLYDGRSEYGEPSHYWMDKYDAIKEWFKSYDKYPERFGLHTDGQILPIYYVKAEDMRIRINEIAENRFKKLAISNGIMTVADQEQHTSWALSGLHPALSDADNTYVYMGSAFTHRDRSIEYSKTFEPTIIHLPYGITDSPQFDVYPLDAGGKLIMPVKTIVDRLESNVGVLIDPLAVDENGYLRVHYLDIQ